MDVNLNGCNAGGGGGGGKKQPYFLLSYFIHEFIEFCSLMSLFRITLHCLLFVKQIPHQNFLTNFQRHSLALLNIRK